MSFNSYGTLFRVTTFGESHGPALGAIVDGAPAFIALTEDMIQKDLDRRKPGTSRLHSTRREPDQVRILSGVFMGKTTGTPIALCIENQNARSKDYQDIQNVYRPGHADFTWDRKFGFRDYRGGGRASGRETAARVAAGAVARAMLATLGIDVIGATRQIGSIRAQYDFPDMHRGTENSLRCPDPVATKHMEQAIVQARRDQDSLGGIVELCASGVPAGIGEPVFSKLDAEIGKALFSIGAVKGVEIGDGFELSTLRGSMANDGMIPPDGFQTNRAGGILGGISTGQNIIARLAVKPTPTIQAAQSTVDNQGNPVEIRCRGRHDPCLVPRLVAVAEAMLCLVLADAVLMHRARVGFVQPAGESS